METPAIGSMRMPLYFILSGLFFKDYGDYKLFFKKKVNNLIIPFIFFSLLSFIPVLLRSKVDWIELILKPYFKPDMENLPIWFLMSLFWVNVLYYLPSKIRNIKIRSLSILSLGCIGLALSHYRIYLPLFISGSFSAVPFFYIGVLLRKTPLLYKSNRDKLYLTICIIMMSCSILYQCLYSNVYFGFLTNVYIGNIIEIYINSIVMVMGLLMICKAIGWLPIISYMGRYSIIILGLHWIILMAICGYIHFKLLKLTIVLLFCWGMIPVCRKFAPHLTAQADLFSWIYPKKKKVQYLANR